YPGVFVGMVTIGALGLLTSTVVELAGRRVTAWLPRPAARGAAPRTAPSVPVPASAPASADVPVPLPEKEPVP
ncbi:ABC transporter permease, partial [Streptomyces hydrogenans]